MKFIEPAYYIETYISAVEVYRLLERMGRTCYKSEHKITNDSAEEFVRKIIERGHESVLEHFSYAVRFVCDRGVSHELVRHRLCAFSQESTRYCNYDTDRFEHSVTFIKPPFFTKDSFPVWARAMENAEQSYFKLLEMGASPQEARSVLPNSLKTEIVVTANLREWRHIFELRTSPKAHPQMRQIMIPLRDKMHLLLPVIF